MQKAVFVLSFIVASRFLGLFIVLPVFSVYSADLAGASELNIGVALGAYAISQMIFQVPFGVLSDKIGRKTAMLLGLLIFIAGSIMCALASDIWTMALGRLVQGAGAVGAVAVAMISDFTAESTRGRAMMVMGMMIGSSFALALILSPVLCVEWGFASLFYLSAALSAACIVLLYTLVPSEHKTVKVAGAAGFARIFAQKDLMIMNVTNFAQKMFINSIFMVIPFVLMKKFGMPREELWNVYLYSMIFGFLAMGFAGFWGDKYRIAKGLLIVGAGVFIVAFLNLAMTENRAVFLAGVAVFFVGFNLHEPILQSTASRFALSHQRGAALGVFSAFGYAGSFAGGALGGLLLAKVGFTALAFVYCAICAGWIWLLLRLTNPNVYSNLNVGHVRPNLPPNSNLKKLGIFDIFNNGEEWIIKFDSRVTDALTLKKIIQI